MGGRIDSFVDPDCNSMGGGGGTATGCGARVSAASGVLLCTDGRRLLMTPADDDESVRILVMGGTLTVRPVSRIKSSNSCRRVEFSSCRTSTSLECFSMDETYSS